ncbi:Flavin-dependent monooxygenase, oxygenase subunit HsaA [Alphaproteobacteria bacterium SO-S41]|nr:Flavin-dependent monooxygenase, oxygenase subunit HsaA [Alphaproteobacteria bacterium SO-S41]
MSAERAVLPEYQIVPQRIPAGDDFLSDAERAALTPEIVIERLKALKPFLAEQAPIGEAQGYPSDAAWSAIRKTGYFYLTVPKVHGGLECTFDQMLDATFAICEGDPAIGWLASFCVMNARSAAAFSKAAREELFGNGRYSILTSLLAPYGQARKVEGGYIVSGQWHWGTTIQLADWVSVSAHLETPETGKTIGAFLMPANQVQPLKTWDAHGLIATGTHQVRVDNVFVPEYRATPHNMQYPGWIQRIRADYEYELFTADLRPALTLTIGVPLIGIARGALEIYRDHLKAHFKRGTENTESVRPISQARLARATAMVSGAELLLRDSARRIYANRKEPDYVQEQVSFEERGRISYAANQAREAVLFMAESAGTSLHYHSNRMSQYLRDMLVGSTHVAVDLDINLENAGRALLGLPPQRPTAPRIA